MNFIKRIKIIYQNIIPVFNIWLSRRFAKKPKYLPILILFVTNKCNLRCPMCGVWEKTTDMGKELDTCDLKNIIDSAKLLGTKLIAITGGEPLLRDDIFEIIGYARTRGISVHLCSNGILLDKDNTLLLKKSGLNSISISLDGYESEIHERIRGKKSFEQTLNGIKNCINYAPDIKLGINYLITAKNYKNMYKMVSFAEKLGVHQIKFAPIHTNLQHKNRHLKNFANLLFFTKENIESLEREVSKLTDAINKSNLISLSPIFFSGISSLYKKRYKFKCYAGYATCAISPSGQVSPCCDMNSDLNIQNETLQKIWQSDNFHNLRKKVDSCKKVCWDTTNVELSLKFRLSNMFTNLKQAWHEVLYYFSQD